MKEKKSIDIAVENIKYLMLKGNISARALSRLSNKAISHRMVGLIVAPDRDHDLTLTKLDVIAGALGVTTADLLNPLLPQMLPLKDALKQLDSCFIRSDEGGRKLILDLAQKFASDTIDDLPEYTLEDIPLPSLTSLTTKKAG